MVQALKRRVIAETVVVDLKMRLLQYTILSLLFCACSSQKHAKELSDAQMEILNSIVGEKVYHKTIISEFDEPISNYVENNFLEFNLCFEGLGARRIEFSEEELKILKNQFDSQVKINLNRISPKLKQGATRKREEFKTVSISLPAVFRGDSLALYYISGRYGGEFSLLQKKSGTWQKACSSLVWIE
jgi:hypothetical protein